MSPDAELELDAGALLEPLAAPLLGWLESLEDELLLELGAGELGAVLVEPPAAESFFVASLDEEELEEDDGGVPGVTVTEPDVELEPEGAVAGGVVEPEDDEEVEPGWLARLSPTLSPQAVSKLAPKTIETATAKVESLMLWASVVGVKTKQQGLGPCR